MCGRICERAILSLWLHLTLLVRTWVDGFANGVLCTWHLRRNLTLTPKYKSYPTKFYSRILILSTELANKKPNLILWRVLSCNCVKQRKTIKWRTSLLSFKDRCKVVKWDRRRMNVEWKEISLQLPIIYYLHSWKVVVSGSILKLYTLAQEKRWPFVLFHMWKFPRNTYTELMSAS